MGEEFHGELEELEARGLRRRLRVLEGPQRPEITVGCARLLNFSSNDYLGLSGAPALCDEAKAAVDEYGVGAGASRLVCGTLRVHADLEERLAQFKRTEAALVFSSGYAAAIGVLGAMLRGAEDVVILDKLCHASLVDGARLSGATLRVFRHNDLGQLEERLRWARERSASGRVLVVTESVFSMDGDQAPLREIVALKQRHGALLLLDEAHAVGLLGTGGRGLADALGVAAEVDLQMGTLSKALGGTGGYVCASRAAVDLLVNRARSFIYSTAPAPAAAAVALAALAVVESPEGDALRARLAANVACLGNALHGGVEGEASGVASAVMRSAIIPWILGGAERALEASANLQERGFLVPAIRFPTVPHGTARLRMTLSSVHHASDAKELGRCVRGFAQRPMGG